MECVDGDVKPYALTHSQAPCTQHATDNVTDQSVWPDLVFWFTAESVITLLLLLLNKYWLRWHSHVKDIAGAPHNHYLAKKKYRQKGW